MPDYVSKGGSWVQVEKPKDIMPAEEIKAKVEPSPEVKEVKEPVTKSKPRGRPKKGR